MTNQLPDETAVYQRTVTSHSTTLKREKIRKKPFRVHFVPPKFPHIYHLACQTASSTNSSRFPLVINCHKVCIVICGLDSYYQTLSSRVENSKKNILWQHAGASRKNFSKVGGTGAGALVLEKKSKFKD